MAHIGGALEDSLVDYRLNLEDKHQDANNIYKMLKGDMLSHELRVASWIFILRVDILNHELIF